MTIVLNYKSTLDHSKFKSLIQPFQNSLQVGRVSTHLEDPWWEMHLVGCCGARHHVDKLDAPYSLLFVIQNDGFIVKGQNQTAEDVPHQEPGSVLLLAHEQFHHCRRPDGRRRGLFWIGLVVLIDEPGTQEDMEDILESHWDDLDCSLP